MNTWEEFSDDANDGASAFVSAFDLEDIELFDECALLGFGNLSGVHFVTERRFTRIVMVWSVE